MGRVEGRKGEGPCSFVPQRCKPPSGQLAKRTTIQREPLGAGAAAYSGSPRTMAVTSKPKEAAAKKAGFFQRQVGG